MTSFGRALVYTTAALGLLAFGACSNTGENKNVAYGGAESGGATAQGGFGALGGFAGSLGGLGGGGSSSGGGGGTGPQPTSINDCPGSLDPAAAQALQA